MSFKREIERYKGLPPMQDQAEYEDRCISEGDEIIRSTTDTVLLDLDGETAINQFYKNIKLLPILIQSIEFKYEVWTSKSGKNKHVLLHISDAMPPVDRLLLAVILGSDAQRAIINYGRLLQGNDMETFDVLRKPKKGMN